MGYLRPKLGFLPRSDWCVKTLSEVAHFRNGKAHEQDIDENGEFIVVNSKFISTGGRVKKYSESLIAPLEKNEVVMVMSDVPKGKALARCLLINQSGRYTLNQRICALSPRDIAPQFLFYRLNRLRYFLEFDSGVGQTNLRKDEILDCRFAVPGDYEEQQKIADFLTSVDTRIQQLKQKQSLLQQYKKGLMQQLFSQTLRFKDDNGNPFPDWRSGVFGDLAVKTSSNITSASVSVEGPHLVYGASGKAGYIEYFQNQNQYVGIVKDGAGAGRVALCEPKTSVLATMDALHPKETIDVNYLFQFIQTLRFAKYVIGSTIPHIYFSDYKAEKCQIPCLEEQTKIARALAAMDKKLDLVAQQIEHTRTFKKGLLQQMFV